MSNSGQQMELFRLMYGDEAGKQWELASERLQGWARAFDAWLEFEQKSKHGKVKRKHALAAWRKFYKGFSGAPWAVRPEDVEALVDRMHKDGLAHHTIQMYLQTLARFYEYVKEQAIDPEVPAGFNPAQAAKKPPLKPYHLARVLLPEEARQLLQAAFAGGLPMNRRDYALLLLALRTGLEAGSIRQLTWSDLKIEREAESEIIWLTTPSRRAPVRLPPDAGRAILDYLAASGRLESIQPEDYLFAPLTDSLLSESSETAASWDAHRPISIAHMTVILQRCVARAGLRGRGIIWPSLKHTSALLKVEAGAEIEELEAFLGREHYPRHTLRYLCRLAEHLEGQATRASIDTQGEDTGKALPPDPTPEQTYANHLHGMTHGLYAKHIPEEDLADLQAHPLKDLKEEIDTARYVIGKAVAWMKADGSLEEQKTAAEIFNRTAGRLALLVKMDQALNPRSNPDDVPLVQILREVADETGWDLFPNEPKPPKQAGG